MRLLCLLLLLGLAACGSRSTPPPTDWDAWVLWVEARAAILDDDGHGPDLGSEEWAMAVSQKLGVIDPEGHGPDLDTAEWRAAVEHQLRRR